jgi:hypothetical protein
MVKVLFPAIFLGLRDGRTKGLKASWHSIFHSFIRVFKKERKAKQSLVLVLFRYINFSLGVFLGNLRP